MRRVPAATLITVVLLLAAFGSYFVTKQVRFNEVGVRVKLGQASAASVIDTPGLYVKWPPPIEWIYTYDARIRTTDTPETEGKTLDGKNLIVSAYALWRIKDPYQYYVRVTDDQKAVELLRTRLGQVRSAAIGKRELSYFVNLDNEQVQRNWDALEAEMLEAAAPGVLADYGIELLEVSIRRISLPEQVTRTVFQAMAKNAERLAARYREEGKSLGAAIKARAEAERRQILAFTETRAQEIRSQGAQRATQFMSEVRPEDMEFYEFLRQMDALRIALASKATLFLDSNSPLFRPLTEPLGGFSGSRERGDGERRDSRGQ
jgi:membrane protease subunit HflC